MYIYVNIFIHTHTHTLTEIIYVTNIVIYNILIFISNNYLQTYEYVAKKS